jgi:hypothetical protein
VLGVLEQLRGVQGHGSQLMARGGGDLLLLGSASKGRTDSVPHFKYKAIRELEGRSRI